MALSEIPLSDRYPGLTGHDERMHSADAELLLQMEKYYPFVTSRTALAAHFAIQELHGRYTPGSPPKEEMEQWKSIIDQCAADAMIQALHALPFPTHKVGSEGDKEIHYAGEAAASVKGTYGEHNDGPWMEAVSDVVEGTTPASQGKPGASSVIAVVKKPDHQFGIRPTPEGVHYLMKFVGPPQARNVVSLDNDHEENLRRLLEVLDIRPEELTQVTMDPSKPGREVNQQYVDAARKVGVTIKLISVGDFMPGVLATLNPRLFGTKPHIVVGRGGYEEGIMTAAAARALGGFMEAREYDKDPQKFARNRLLQLTRDLVPADPNHCLVSATFITPDIEWFKKPGVTEGYRTTTMVVTHKGIEFQTHTHPATPLETLQ